MVCPSHGLSARNTTSRVIGLLSLRSTFCLLAMRNSSTKSWRMVPTRRGAEEFA